MTRHTVTTRETVAMTESSESRRPRLALLMGDVAGVGPELVARVLANRRHNWQPLVVGHPDVLTRALRLVGLDTNVRHVDSARRDNQPADSQDINCWNPSDSDVADAPVAQVDPRCGRAAADWLQAAAMAALDDHIDALVTAPLNKTALAAAGIDDPADIHYVQSKSPLLTTESIADAKSRGFSVCTEETIESMSFANATAALGIGVALGEFPMPREDQIGRDLDVYSSVASCSSGNEQVEAQIIVVGNKKGAGGRFRIGHSVMKDAIDTHGIYDAIRNAGLPLSDRPHPSDLGDAVVNCFVKCETDPRGLLRGHRLVSLNDTDVHHTHQTKAAVGGVAAAAIGDCAQHRRQNRDRQGRCGNGESPLGSAEDWINRNGGYEIGREHKGDAEAGQHVRGRGAREDI